MSGLLLRALRPEPSSFEVARVRWAECSARRRELKDRLAGARAALALLLNPPGDQEPRSPAIAEKARAYLAGRVPSRDALARDIAALEDEIRQAEAAHAHEAQAWRDAATTEGARLAALLKPRHRVAVRRIAALVQQLSAAVEAERAILAELTEVGSNALPSAGVEFGTLAEYSSLLSQWNRRLIGAGLVD